MTSMSSRNLRLPVLIATVAVPLCPLQGQSTVLTREQIEAFDPIGTCEGGGRSFDLRRVMFLENQSIDVDGPSGPLRVTISREHLLVEDASPGARESQTRIDIDSEVDINDDLDLELKLAYFDQRLVLYWKETYRHRFYRQGLFAINGREVRSLCSGQGGSHMVH